VLYAILTNKVCAIRNMQNVEYYDIAFMGGKILAFNDCVWVTGSDKNVYYS